MKIIKKNNLFGRRIRYSQLFLQNLKLRKDKRLYNRNFIKNYFFYKFLLNSFKNKKTIFLTRSLFLLNNNKILINPSFSYKKKIFNYNSKYSDFLKKTNLNSIFLSKYYLNKFYLNSYFGLNHYLISNDIINNNLINITNNDDFKDVVKFKFILNNDKIFNSNYDFNVFFNYNIFINNTTELYKIIILLNLVKISF